MTDEVLILPCNGIGNPLSTISRYAAYETARLVEQHGGRAKLMAIGRLLARLPEAIDEVCRAKTVVVIEACEARCASLLLEQLGAEVAVYVYVPQIMRQAGVGIRGIDRKFLGPKGRALVEAVATATMEAIEKRPRQVSQP